MGVGRGGSGRVRVGRNRVLFVTVTVCFLVSDGLWMDLQIKSTRLQRSFTLLKTHYDYDGNGNGCSGVSLLQSPRVASTTNDIKLLHLCEYLLCRLGLSQSLKHSRSVGEDFAWQGGIIIFFSIQKQDVQAKRKGRRKKHQVSKDIRAPVSQ